LKSLVAALCMLTIPALAIATPDGPQPPCDSTAAPAYSPPGVKPVVEVWHGDDLKRSGWKPPECSGWTPSAHAKLILVIAGSFRFDGTADDLVARIGAISTLRGVRYWSVTDKDWRPLIIEAWALSGPDPHSRRPDFLPAEMTPGRELYYLENDNRSGKIVQRMTVRERSPARTVIAIENLTPVRFLLVTLFEPGALQTVEFFELISPGVWGVYLMTQTTGRVSAPAGGHEASYINRAMAIYRHRAGLPADGDPPAAQ
jgi:hypothetical protein